MSRKALLILEGLPDDLDRLRPKLDLYFRNKRRSGGEVCEIQDDPADKRKALLVYDDDEAPQKVLSKGPHQIDFKGPLGVVELRLSLAGEPDTGVEEEKKIHLLNSAASQPDGEKALQSEVDCQAGSAHHEGPKADTLSLLVTSEHKREFLEMYFEQFAAEPSLIKHGTNTWILQLASKADMEKVCAKEGHGYGISTVVYTAEGRFDPRRFVLSGFDDGCTTSFVSVYIGSCSSGAEHTWETLDDGDRIVVTFKQDIDVSHFLKRCSTKTFEDREIEARRLEFTDSVLVQGDMSQISEDTLHLYFSNNKSRGGNVKSLTWVSMNRSVVITFEECHVAYRVADHKHTLTGQQLVAQLFYSNLLMVLTGKTAIQPNIPTTTVMAVSADLLRFINFNETCNQEFMLALKKVNTRVSVKMDADPPQLELSFSMEEQSLGMLRQGHSWQKYALREAQAQLERYMEDRIPTEVEAWREIEASCLELSTANALISFESCTSEIVVVGFKADVKIVLHTIKSMVEKASDELQIKRDTTEKKICLNSKEELELICNLVSDKIIDDVVLSKDEKTFTIYLKGLRNKVNTVEGLLKEVQNNVVSSKLDLSPHMTKFMKSLDLKKFHNDHFTQNNIMAVLLPVEQSFQILADKADVHRAEDKLSEVIEVQVIELSTDQVNVTRGQQWKQYFYALKEDLKSSQNHESVIITLSDDEINVCGFSYVVSDVVSKVREYLQNKKPVTIDIPLKSVLEVNFIKSCMKFSDDPDFKALGAKVLYCKTPGLPCLKVTAASDQIKQATDMVTLKKSKIITEKLIYLKAGEAKILEKNQLILMAQANLLGCDLSLSQSTTVNNQQYSYKLSVGVTLTLGQGDISQYTSDALVCPLSSLSFDNPIAQQFLQFGGPEIKRVVNKLQKEKQSLVAGNAVLTDPGSLKSKKLIYAIVPVQTKDSSSLNRTCLQAVVRESLVKAANHKCVSIAMPALGCGTFGFPVKESCQAMINGILNIVSLGHTTLTNIYMIDSDATVVTEFKSAIEGSGYEQTVGPSVSPATETSRGTSAPLLAPKPTSSSKVIGGVSVFLKKGDITKETVDVIVNSTNMNLNLNTGVSGAILEAAGAFVKEECKQHGTQRADGVVLTGGGRLACKHIAHMVGPKNAADIATSIEKVLQLCESKMATTIAIPTIGTGKGGIDLKNSTKAILKGLKNHLSQTASSCLKRLFLVAFEDQVLASMKDYFNKINRPKKKSQATAASAGTHPSPHPKQVRIHGVWVEVRKGDITKESVKCIVNTTTADIHSRGVSAAILREAGSTVQQECQKIWPLKGNDAAVTSAGALQCDFIIHIRGPHSVAKATVRVMKVLERCEEKNITTVSFPAIGAGGGGLSSSESIGGILQGIKYHLSKRASSVLRLIYIVINYDKNLQEYLQGLKQWNSNEEMPNDTDEDSDESTSSEEYDDTWANPSEALVGPLRVRVICGDITKEKTDAVVSSTNTSLNRRSGVSGAILKAAGHTVVDECEILGTQPKDGVVITKPGNLTTRHIIHMVGPTEEKAITNSMLKVLKMCEDHKLQSVSFPALGTGAGNLKTPEVGNAMVTAIEHFLTMTKTPSLTAIHLVIFQPEMMKSFQEVLKKMKKPTPKPAATSKMCKFPNMPGATQSTSAVSPIQHPVLCLASACKAVSFPAMHAEVLGCSVTNLAQMKKMMDNQISQEYHSVELPSSQFPLLLEAEKRTIVELSQKNQVCVLLSTRDKATISGKRDDVLDMVVQIKTLLEEAEKRERRKEEVRRLQETVRWEVREGETWQELDKSVSVDLEHAWLDKRASVNYKHQGKMYTVDLKTMQRRDHKGTITTINRTLKTNSDTVVIRPPPTWTRMDNKQLDIVDLDPTSEEYKKVEKKIIQTSRTPNFVTQSTIKVVKIQRIQNKGLWQMYAVKKQALDKKHPTNKNEMNLYHGTTAEICQRINTNGFNRSFCGRNASSYGEGTYFAKESWYSCQDSYSDPDASGLKHVYQARVLVGRVCKGVAGMKEPKPLDPRDPLAGLHDCAVDNPHCPFIYVVFCDAGAYPEYLISFKTS
ncbi:protein mono-ADP-ribosyltransferase PARP14 isoform X2 [Lampris incognitus]|uniref:protein mono-ADP-ribosyltransferase PARP14 isoform X2 n=1 Tax=Lampris incognitus TaxID=2546036 RepID=UPI0024B5076A|nr:protein mono-ADP-ribosyltransferase PARP14 isoform X2 [Lampris incognitus]